MQENSVLDFSCAYYASQNMMPVDPIFHVSFVSKSFSCSFTIQCLKLL